MPITYPEGGMPGLVLRQRRGKPVPIETFRVQLVPMRPAPNVKIGGPEDVVTLVREMEDYDRESAKIIHLDTKNQVMGIETISIGSLNASIVHPRETVKGAILNNSANVIFVHNHPSGICEPSREDTEITGRLKEAFEIVGISLLDSLIVGKGCYYSFAESGALSGKGASSGTVKELIQTKQPCVRESGDQQTKEKVDFITAMTDYITAPDVERRKRAAEKIQVSRYYKPWFDEFFFEHDRESAKRKLMKFFVANEQGLGFVNHAYYGVLSEYLRAISKSVAELTVRDGRSPHTVSENILPSIEDYLNRRTVDTGRHSVPASAIIGAAVPENGYLVAYHVTDNPEGVMQMLRSSSVLTEQTTVDDLGSGFYVSGVPQYWFVRSREKWAFARNLTRAQRQRLVDVILSDPDYRKGGGYLADFEVDYLNRDLKQYVETGDVDVLAMTGNQPYNVRVTEETARKAGVPVPKVPGMVKVKFGGKFIHAEGMYFNPEIEKRAREWAGSLEGRKKLAQWFVATTPKNIVNAWLRSKGYSGAFTKSGMSTNPEMVIWDRRAIIDFRIIQAQG